MGKVRKRINNLYHRKYDYYYLKSCFDKLDNSIDTLVIGSSYACFGFNPSESQVCMGLPSQDIYYSDALIRKAVDDPITNLKNVALIVGYNTLYCDLSKTKNMSERQRITDVYIPVLRDPHHFIEDSVKVGGREKLLQFADGVIIDIMKHTCFGKPIGAYFERKNHTRLIRRRIMWDDVILRWDELAEKDRDKAGCLRMKEHEKGLVYRDSYEENLKIMQALYSYLQERKITLYVIIAPFPDSYRNHMSENYKSKAKQAETELKKYSNLYIDFNRQEELGNWKFKDEDFVDTDHLNDQGAEKFTEILNSILERNRIA